MPLNATESEQVNQAIDDLSKKVGLEKSLQNDLKAFFKTMSVDLRAFYSVTGHSITASSYQDNLRGIIEKHGNRTANKFKFQITRYLLSSLKNDPLDDTTKSLIKLASSRGLTPKELILQIQDSVQVEISKLVTSKSDELSRFITRTNQREIDVSIMKAEIDLLDELGRDPTRREVSNAASSIFRDRSINRIGTISSGVIQRVSEATKHIEREELFKPFSSLEAAQDNIEPPSMSEVWVNQADSLVRDGSSSRFNHLAADGQEKKNGIFIVSGESLLFPGDTSLGASIGNIINCRCSDVTILR